MSRYALENLMDRLSETMDARENDRKAREMYGYRYSGCRQQEVYENAIEGLDEAMKEYIKELLEDDEE